jgi:AcrR family transcriptional regulator
LSEDGISTLTKSRRIGVDGAKNRELLIDAAEHILCDEGYAAITARSVATKAGLKVPLVYYYFQTMDDLIAALVKKNTAHRLERFVKALASPEPLRALWKLNSDPSRTIPATELIAMANHYQSVRTEIVAAAKQFRNLQIDAMRSLLAARGIDEEIFPAGAVVTIITALTRSMAQDYALGVSDGYDEAVMVVERTLDLLTKPNTRKRQGKPANRPSKDGA